jgi:hypothetical protein
MKRISQMTLLGLLAAALVALPASSRAEGPNANEGPASTEKPPHGKPDKTDKPGKRGTPFHGKLAAVDAGAMTITVGTMIIHVNADTKVTRHGQPATLADGTVGEPVSGAYQKADDGQLNATVVHFGGKSEGKPEGKAKEKPEKPPKESSEAGGDKK